MPSSLSRTFLAAKSLCTNFLVSKYAIALHVSLKTQDQDINVPEGLKVCDLTKVQALDHSLIVDR